MADEPQPSDSLRDRISAIHDPDGEHRATRDALVALARVPLLRRLLPVEKIEDLTAREEELLQHTEAAILRFAPLGWAPSGSMPIDAYGEALAALDAHPDAVESAETVIADAWDDPIRLRRPVHQVRFMAATDNEWRPQFHARADLLQKALDHHLAGNFEASVPIVLAQVEGLVADVSGGKMFFSRDTRRKAEIIGDDQIATLHESLPVVREFFSRNQSKTESTGDARRHGILHGRELAYDTRINSVKCFVLLQAIVEWAQPNIRERVEAREAEHRQRWSGSDEVDADGRRMDRREFEETCSTLDWIHTCHMGWHRRLGRYRRDLWDILEASVTVRGLPEDHGVHMLVAEDGTSWWAYRQTVTGWCLGIGAVGPVPDQRYFEGPNPPTGGPEAVPDEWSEPFDAPVNWE